MALEQGIPDYWVWLLGDPVNTYLFRPETWGFLPGAAALCLLLLFAAPFFCFIVAAFQYGPSEAFYYVARAMFSAVTEDLPRFSFRRTFAVARLAVQEAIRNRVLVGFGVFVIVLLFAGLFLDVSNNNPARVYLSVVLMATNYLVLLMALFLSTFSIPNDIKNRTIYTVVTKPIRASEIVVGRVLGFMAVGTAMLAVMGLLSYIFVVRGLAHEHQIDIATVVADPTLGESAARPGYRGQTTFDAHHRHTFEIDKNGEGRTNVVAGHWHTIQARNMPHLFDLVDLDSDGKLSKEELKPPPEPDAKDSEDAASPDAQRRLLLGQVELNFAAADQNKDGVIAKGEFPGPVYHISPPAGALVARAPIYGELLLLGDDGRPGKGISVGDEWEYRGYITGGTPGVQTRSAAIWTFEGVTEQKFPKGLPIEINMGVFRTHKGDIEQGVLGEIVIRNPDPDARVKRSGPILFESKEFVADYRVIPRQLNSEVGARGDVDLFKDLVSDGKVEVEIRCVESGQYFGVAEPDVYLRPADATFAWNFVKAYIGIWLQMLLVTSFGVTFSTFLTGSIAMLATLGSVVLGMFGDFIRKVTGGIVYGDVPAGEGPEVIPGGGPIESAIRMVTQQSQTTELEMNNLVAYPIKAIDWFLMEIMQGSTYILPNYTRFDGSAFVADGYNIFGSLLAEQITMAAVYFVVVTIVGYFFLKTREIAA